MAISVVAQEKRLRDHCNSWRERWIHVGTASGLDVNYCRLLYWTAIRLKRRTRAGADTFSCSSPFERSSCLRHSIKEEL